MHRKRITAPGRLSIITQAFPVCVYYNMGVYYFNYIRAAVCAARRAQVTVLLYANKHHAELTHTMGDI
jgi:hypothetical protein